jgi:blocked-early-in-transport protein 1
VGCPLQQQILKRSPLSPSFEYRGRQSRPGGASLFGDGSSVEMQMRNDPESLERDNDAAIGHMSDRVAMLRSITDNIHDEAESHKKLLDGMGDSMGGVGETLGETVKHFNAVFVNNKNGRQFCYAVWGMVGVIWCLHYLSSG